MPARKSLTFADAPGHGRIQPRVLDKVSNQQTDVLFSGSKTSDLNREYMQPVNQIAAERPSAGSSITRSKLQLQPALHDARIHAHSADLSERARTRDIARWIRKVRAIEDVENLPAKNDPDFLPESSALDESRVEVTLVRPSKDVPS